ncbi:MAG: hypothetical protein CO094_03970 [Anaerolineae bacterium CG_4_9_14_3_um_filter_57_17]|nr:hypothetical protein [bacterium]NCT22016.1 hypothetical protein [bacterium]OIO86217.1 MAG: hypothetical protein AUK01_03880 [Anaerolineae bacterium CG2_30_57_67]PJB67438.1 MAG: hypothetical protein CO094_03970 [Anaerolineae bacterium CG_4_9_14_3_um_filter_57_17]
MQAIRRFYFYLVALISLEVVLWGVIRLARTLFNGNALFSSGETLAQALALILVGIPIFLIHWLWAQHAAARDAEEQSASLRALFLYAALLGTLVPVIQNTLALLNRLLLQASQISRDLALLGGGQTLSDNLLAIVFNLLAAAYFWNILRGAWKTLAERENFSNVRRLYRHLWLAYSLFMLVFGAQKILYFALLQFSPVLGLTGNDILLNGLALTLVGAPLWAYTWQTCQRALNDPFEQASGLRMGVLYVLALSGVGATLVAAGNVLYFILLWALGSATTFANFLQQISGQISVAAPLAVIWAYYGGWFNREAGSAPWANRRAEIRRLYFYALAPAGLATTVTGVGILLSLLINISVGAQTLWGDFLRQQLAMALATLAVGIPLWLATWRPMQSEALTTDEAGEHARKSVIRRFYLYAVIFVAVIGGMFTAVALAYTLLKTALTGDTPPTLAADLLNLLMMVMLFAAVLIYHSVTLRHDVSQTSNTLAEKHKAFEVWLLTGESADFGARMSAALQRQATDLTVKTIAAGEALPPETSTSDAVILPAALALNPPSALRTWLEAYRGLRVIVPSPTQGWLWVGASASHPEAQAAQIIRQLAEGEKIRLTAGTSAWTVVAYIFAALFGLQLLFGLIGLIIALLTSF